MSDDTVAVFENRALDKGLAKRLRKMGKRRARSHGNYLPALDAVLDFVRRRCRDQATALPDLLPTARPRTTPRCFVSTACRRGGSRRAPRAV